MLLEAMVLKGALSAVGGTGPKADMVSAPFLAREAGIESVVSSEPPENVGSPYWNLLTVEAERVDGSSASVTGSVFGSQPHIVQVDGYADSFSFRPEGKHILTFRNEDRPGAIGEVLAVLHEAAVNIASVNVARGGGRGGSGGGSGGGGQALCFMALDDDVSADAMEAIRRLPALHNVSIIHLNQ